MASGLAAVASLVAASASAYRPFDGTDAAVAAPGEFELELGPVGYHASGGQRSLVAPSTVLNLGLGAETELVVDFRNFVPLDREPGGAPFHVLDTDVLLKHVVRAGTLQDATGVSIAAEGGVLTPELNGKHGYGASLDVIASYRWPFLTTHLNAQGQYTRTHHGDFFTSLIIEGPDGWRVRPVTELSFEDEVHVAKRTAVLAGAIWTVRDALAIDLGLRSARVGVDREREVRLGFTLAL